MEGARVMTWISDPFRAGPPLRIPDQDRAPGAGPDLRPKALDAWVAGLPLADPERTADLLLEILRVLNRTRLPADQRREAFARLRAPVAGVMGALGGRYAQAMLPLRERDRRCAARVLALAEEGAYAEKALAARPAAALGTARPSGAAPAYPEALARSAAALGRMLLEHYRVYAPVPEGVWGELHRLYRHGEALSGATGGAGPAAAALADLSRAYQRAALLALANPYHLMQGEAHEVDRALGEWVSAARLEPPGPDGVDGRFFVALDGESPPGFGVPGGVVTAGGVRILEVAPVLGRVAERITAFGVRRRAGTGARLSLAQRLERGMWLRLHRAWSARAPRRQGRTPQSAPLRLVVGIGTCHYFLSRGADFRPEWDEVRIRNGPSAGESPQLTLVPKELEPWGRHGEEERLRNGIVRPRESRFDPDDRRHDVWGKIYAYPVDELPTTRGFESSLWECSDVSVGGLAVCGAPPPSTRVRVGQLVGFADSDSNPGEEAWALGVVRWLRAPLGGHLEMGIKRLAERAEPVATRAVVGAGGGTEYFRALGVPMPGPQRTVAALIVPAVMYEVGTVLAVNLGARLLYVQLTRIRESTRAFAQFEYRTVPAPVGEREFLPEIPERRP
ncbi:hypothetical protein BMS3Bbin12_00264 [bacterium BMS3Bbin12]|nr:hypothetical protein BMS3Abin12_01813 [bacterium BMS3Abin12]GBE47110.1 hypothetical protein BMS3Bbin12_00264 [bacterium BMS3Bbin12]GBE51365.1 hypothetical protein BMS3Bbin13_02323 [bacterium BMS3Bbin13]